MDESELQECENVKVVVSFALWLTCSSFSCRLPQAILHQDTQTHNIILNGLPVKWLVCHSSAFIVEKLTWVPNYNETSILPFSVAYLGLGRVSSSLSN